MLEDIAEALIFAADLYENSYNETVKENMLSIRDACKMSCEAHNLDDSTTELVLILISNDWNVALEWAERTLNKSS